ncbi:MAG: hypothetical protein K9L68_13385 [Spirochaetales bacterium]|nr:hypothetical protein [Spirochaetales bacterium]
MSTVSTKITYGTLPFTPNGPSIIEIARNILSSGEKRSLEKVDLLCSYGDIYSPDRLEAACRRALHFGYKDVHIVHEILKKDLDKLALKQGTDIEGQYLFDLGSF